MSDITLGIKITTDGKAAKAELISIEQSVDKLGKSSKQSSRDVKNLGDAISTTAGAAARMAGAFAGLSAAGVVSYIVKTATEFDRLNASLRTVTGSAQNAQQVMALIKQFAASTPYEVQQVTEAFIRLQSLGLNASEKSLRSFGNTASAMGKPLMQFIEAVADASTSEFERLKEFGIKASQEGDKVTFTFRGVSTTVQKTAEDITKYLQQIGDTQFAGGMAQQMDTLGGKLSNLSDAFANLADTIADLGPRSMLKETIGGWSTLITQFNQQLQATFGSGNDSASAAFETRIRELRGALVNEESMRGAGLGFLFSDTEYERKKQALEDAKTQLEKLKQASKDAAQAAQADLAGGMDKAATSIDKVGKEAEATKAYIIKMAQAYKVPSALALGVAQQESMFNQAAVSPAGARGVMQLMDATAKDLKVNSRDALQNIEGGVKYLAQLLDRYNGSLKLTAAAYNAGPGRVDRSGGVPNIAETKNYVERVMANVERYAQQYPDGIKLFDAKEDQRELQQVRSDFDSLQSRREAAAKANETIAKSQLATQVAIAEVQRKAFEEHTKSASGDLTGEAKTRYIEQAAQQELNLIRQSTELKQRAIQIEQQSAQTELNAINQKIAAADRLRLTDNERMQLLGQHQQKQAELASLTQQANAISIQGSGELQRVLVAVAEAYDAQAQAAKKAAEARNELLANLDAEITALEKGVSARKELAAAEKAAADLGKEAQTEYLKQVNQRLDKIDDLKKAEKDREKAEKAVKDEVLRMGQYYQAMVGQAQNAAQGMAQAFGETGAAIGQLVVGLAQYQDTMYNIQQRTEALIEANRKAGGSADKEMEIRAQAMNQELTAQINNYGNLTQAAQSFFDKGTSGYQAMENATKVFRMVELAMTLANYVQMATAGAAYTAQDIAQSEARTTVKGTEAIVNQASGGDPYSAFPRMAAMAAALAALGVAVAGGMSGGSTPSGAVSRSKKSEGTVLGDSTASSNSIVKALDIVAKNSTTDLSYSAAMLRSLQNLEAALAGVTNSVIRNVSPAQVGGLGTRQTISWDPLAIFMKTTKAITDWGIGAFPQMLKDIISSGFEGKTFTDITTTTKLFGMTLSKSTKTMIGDMANETEKQFSLAFRSITDTVREASKAFGTSADDFNRMIETFVVKFDTTSLKGLKGDELEKAIQGQFSKIADQIAASLNIQGLEEFQKVGEGMFETLVRVADGINTANAELEALGITAVKYNEIQFKQGDVAAEIIRQSIVAFEGLNSGIGDFINEAVGSAEDLLSTYQDLLRSRDILKGLGLQWENLNRTMTDAAGGVSKFLDALTSYRDNFYNAGEQLSTDLVGLARQFGNLGLVMPDSKEQFRDLAESIDTSTESGAELFARVIKLSEAFAQASDAADELEKKYKSYTDPFYDFKERIQTVLDDFESILSGRLGGIEAKFANEASLAKTQVNSPLQGEIARLGGIMGTRQAEVAQEYAYIAHAQSRITELQDLINRAMASGNSKLAGYVRSWMGEIDSLNSMIGTLNSDIAAKSRDIDAMNKQIADLQAQIAQNSADIDSGQLSAKLDALTKERARIIRQQGNVLVQTMKEIWDQVAGIIDDARRSLSRQIAELRGGRALVRDSIGAERSALSDLRQYQNSGGRDPQKTVDLVSSAQAAIMQRYNDELERLTNQLERINLEAERAIRAEYRAKEQDVNKQLRADTRAINKQARIDTRDVQREANATIREIERSGNAAIRAYRRQVDAQIAAIDAAEQAATRALEDQQQAQQDALQEQQDARMEALQDAQQDEQKALQKTHDAQMKALQDQLSTAQQLQQAYKQIADYAKSITVGDLSTLSPEQKLAEAQKQYEETLAKARAGDAEAAAKYSQQADTYARLAQQYYGSGTQYDAIYRQIQGDATGLGAMTAPVDPVQKAIEDLQAQQEQATEALQKTQRDESKALQKVFQSESRALSRSQQDAMSALQKSFQQRIDKLNEHAQRIENKMNRDVERQVRAIERQAERTVNHLERQAERQIRQAERAADKQINKIEREQTRAINALTDPNKNEAIKLLRTRTIDKLEKLDDVLVRAKEKAAEHARKQIEYLKSLNILNARQLEQLNKIGTATNAGTTAIPAYASGGVLRPGLATVAEQGVEPIFFGQGGRVLSNSDAKQALTQTDREKIAKLEELIAQVKAIVRQNSAAYPRIAGGIEGLADVSEKAARLAKSRPVAKA